MNKKEQGRKDASKQRRISKKKKRRRVGRKEGREVLSSVKEIDALKVPELYTFLNMHQVEKKGRGNCARRLQSSGQSHHL